MIPLPINLEDFVRQSNLIEGIARAPTVAEMEAHRKLLARPYLTPLDVAAFVAETADAEMRTRHDMNVRVGGHRPPSGGPHIYDRLDDLLRRINDAEMDPYDAHVEYETLHPFMDGNGRSGRAIWLWQMKDRAAQLPPLGFLHRWYYDSLRNARR